MSISNFNVNDNVNDNVKIQFGLNGFRTILLVTRGVRDGLLDFAFILIGVQ
jgi:hypothetical protein